MGSPGWIKVEGDWTCPACGDLQFARNNVCRKCSTPKNADEAAATAAAGGIRPDGDWTCPQCGDLQFARNTVCRKCKTPKPGVDPAFLASAPGEIPKLGCDW